MRSSGLNSSTSLVIHSFEALRPRPSQSQALCLPVPHPKILFSSKSAARAGAAPGTRRARGRRREAVRRRQRTAVLGRKNLLLLSEKLLLYGVLALLPLETAHSTAAGRAAPGRGRDSTTERKTQIALALQRQRRLIREV
ncbi:hypothetical protein FB451DRAFT_1179195 [Mycena latifolia]|nr:hypothetical protein FB451DRAFT_1179195 [Mycena latifolia]